MMWFSIYIIVGWKFIKLYITSIYYYPITLTLILILERIMSRIPFNHNPHISHIYTHKNGYNLWVGDIEAANDLSLLSRL
jgi:hypothetical protein